MFAPLCVGCDLDVGVGAGAGGDDALRRDDARDAAGEVRQQGVAVGFVQAVGFVEDEDERLGFFVELQERLVFVAGHVAVHHEQDGVGLVGDVRGEFGAAFAADFVDAGGVDEVDAAAVEGLPQGVFAVAGFAVQDAGGKDFFAGERV